MLREASEKDGVYGAVWLHDEPRPIKLFHPQIPYRCK